MSGVRLHHPELRNCTYTLIHFGRPLTQPMFCWLCQGVHDLKTYHLGLDQVGDVVVSETVYERLREAGLDGLQATKEIPKPEPLRLEVPGQGTQLRRPLVVAREGRTHG